MDSISNTFSNFYTAENLGDVQLGQANLKEILAALLTEYRIMEHSAKTVGTSTPQGAFHSTILEGLKRLGYPKILQETADLVTYLTNPKFGSSTIGANLSYMAKRSKEDFDIRFDLSFAELNQTLDECKLLLIIKAHRLFLAELCKKICRSYNPTDIDSSKAVYRKFSGDVEQIRNGKTVKIPTFTEHSSVEFMGYTTSLKQVYTRVYAYSDTLGEFVKVFVDAASASKQLAAKLAEEKRPKTIAEQRGSPKAEKKTTTTTPATKTPHTKKVVPVNTSVKTAPPPAANAWSQRQAEFELVNDLVSAAPAVAEAPVEVEAPAAVEAPVEAEVPVEAEFVEVSRKKATVTTKTTKAKKSRAKMLTAIA